MITCSLLRDGNLLPIFSGPTFDFGVNQAELLVDNDKMN